jgi:hypothetical protein
MNKDGMRRMTSALQGRNTHATKEEAQKYLKNFITNNSEENLIGIFGKQSIGTFEVSAMECYPEHNDPKGCFIQRELNPDQTILIGKIKEIIEGIREKAL